MGLWRSIQDWTRTLVGCGAFLVVSVVVGAVVIALLLVFVDPDMLEVVGIKKLDALKTEEEKKAAQREKLVESVKKVHPSRQFANKGRGRPIGKIVAVAFGTGNLDPLYDELPADFAARTPDEIDGIAYVAQSERVVGVYNKGVLFVPPFPPPDGPNAAKRSVIFITIVEPDGGDTIYVSGDIFGSPPPPLLQPGSGPPAPDPPRTLALKYLTSLPRK